MNTSTSVVSVPPAPSFRTVPPAPSFRPSPPVPSRASPGVTPTPSARGTEQIAAARQGLARWLAEHRPATPQTSTNIPGCPAIELKSVQAALATIGSTKTLEDWGTEIEWGEYVTYLDMLGPQVLRTLAALS